MLEVLDPEQNSTFRDHYLDVPFDLSHVMFVCTANELDRVPGPLRDRMEVITLAGYSEDEKLQIAKRYLVPRQLERHGLRKSWLAISDAGLRTIIRDYTREAGVRSLEREIGAVCRKVARGVAEAQTAAPGADAQANGRPPRVKRRSVGEDAVRELLGKPRFQPDAKRRTRVPGVATGLAWTPVGGDVLFVEAAFLPAGKGDLRLTGQLGDVMKESAQAALSYVRGHFDDPFADRDVHIHVPAGAIPKDGPSAGVTMVTALVSLAQGRPVRDDTAMTGEVTLTGQVLPIGGLKEKALAAQRAGLRRVIAPSLNAPDAEEVPEHLRRRIEFVFVEEVGEVLEAALERPRRTRDDGTAPARRRPAAVG
jgi:ATP-dependent Lon protease